MTAPTAQDAALVTRLFRGNVQVPADEWTRFWKCFTARQVPSGGYLLRAGERARWIVVVTHGVLREFYVAPNGDEATRTFCPPGSLSGSLYDLLSGEPSITNIQALEDARVLLVDAREFEAACQRNPAWHQMARAAAEALYQRKIRREYSMLTMDASQRYLALRRELGALETHIPQKHLASYLGVTPEHLSRIRRRQRAAR